jgi:Dyp-type peroxidase family
MAIVPPPPAPVAAPAASVKPALDLSDIQGDVVLGLQKNYQRFIFFKIDDVGAFKANVRNGLLERITTSETVLERTAELAELKREHRHEILPLVGLNIAFAKSGIDKLAAGVELGDPSFDSGAIARAAANHDPVSAGAPLNWLPEFLAPIDGVMFVTGGTEHDVDDESEIVLTLLGGSIDVLYTETANVRPGLERGHEHFGFSDGISQPALDVANLPAPNPGQDVVDPGLFVFGYGSQATPPVALMNNGSFMVFRRLRQLVPEFETYLQTQAATLGMDPVILGGRMMGRWKSGAPMELTPVQDDIELGADDARNNDFDYSDDQAQRRCPFGAHIRKTNPRRDIPEAALDVRRIIRAGIAYGPEVDAAETLASKSEQDRGLMFVCYQTSIVNQFEFVQQSWANNPGFVSAAIPALVKHRPGDGTPVTVGFDPIIGQQADHTQPRSTDEPVPNYPTGNVRSTLNEPADFVVPTGAAYFFVPSLSALGNELSA